MPIGCGAAISTVIGKLEELQPRTVLDVGCGFGSYGVLFRQYLDVMQGRYFKNEWQARIEAIEIWPDYINPIHMYVYDRITIADVRELIKGIEKNVYDLIFAGDLIEHLTRDEGRLFIEQAKYGCKHLIIVTPAVFCDSVKEYKGNTHEQHLSFWSIADFEALGFEIPKDSPTVAYCKT